MSEENGCIFGSLIEKLPHKHVLSVADPVVLCTLCILIGLNPADRSIGSRSIESPQSLWVCPIALIGGIWVDAIGWIRWI